MRCLEAGDIEVIDLWEEGVGKKELGINLF
jgi:hypothetical protein